MATLYELTTQMTDLEDAIASLDEVEHEEAIATLSGWLTLAGGELADKIDAYVALARDCKVTAEARRQEAKHLVEMAKADENLVSRLKDAAKYAAQVLDTTKLKGHKRTITVSTRKDPAIDIISEDEVPEQFKEQVVSWKIDKKGIASHILATGESVRGVMPRDIVSVLFR
jgi:hypothetical protein